MALGPALLTAGTLLLLDFPEAEGDPGVLLKFVGSHSTRHQVAALFIVLGLLIGVWGLTGVAHLLRGRHVTIGQLGAALMIVSAFLGNTYAFAVVVGAVARTDPERAQVIALLGDARSSGWFSIVRLATLISVLSLILLAVGLVLRRATALWVPVLLAVAAVERSVLAETGLALGQRTFAVLDAVLFALPAAGLAARILRMSDEEWSRWIPLDRAEAPIADTGVEEFPAPPAGAASWSP